MAMFDHRSATSKTKNRDPLEHSTRLVAFDIGHDWIDCLGDEMSV